MVAFPGPGPTIRERDTPIEVGMVPFAGRGPTVLLGEPAVGRSSAPGQREANNDVGTGVPTCFGLGLFGRPISLVRVAVALLRRSVAFVGVEVSLASGLVPHHAGQIPLIRIAVAIVGVAVTLTVLTRHRAGLIPLMRIPVGSSASRTRRFPA